jgi:4-methyl-5(b-hydroxyethyl)-thiazole monophosphate biosynthesis
VVKNNMNYLKTMQGGMPGAERLQKSESLTKILKKQAEAGRVFGAICAAPAVVFEANGLLEVMEVI